MQIGLAINQGGNGGRGIGEIKIGIKTKVSINPRSAGNRKEGGSRQSFALKCFCKKNIFGNQD